MNFKSTVIICALYFVTVTQSIGLNGKQLADIREYSNADSISNEDIENIGIKLGLNDMSDFVNKDDVSDTQKLLDLLVFLADKDKTTDSLMERYLSPFEVRLYEDQFSEYVQKGNGGGLPHNVLDFLHHKWEVKPKGYGIDRAKVQQLIDLRADDSTIKDKHISPQKVTQLFKKLHIVDNYKSRFAFHSTRNPFLELQELLIITAEYSNNYSQGTHVYSTPVVRYVLSVFSKLDKDKDGLLSYDEVLSLISPQRSMLKRSLTMGPCTIKHDTNVQLKYLDKNHATFVYYRKSLKSCSFFRNHSTKNQQLFVQFITIYIYIRIHLQLERFGDHDNNL